jgi:hypothetical protein
MHVSSSLQCKSQPNSLLTLKIQEENKIENEDSDKKDSSSCSSSSFSSSFTNWIGSGNPSFARLDVAMCSNLDSMPVTSSLIASGTEGVFRVDLGSGL